MFFKLHNNKKLHNVREPSINLNPKFYPINYNEPEKKDMAVIMVYFNATKSVRIAQNILLVKQHLDNANIPYYIGELSIDGSPYLFKESYNIFHYKTDDYMFYKENLINLVEARIPDEYTKICNIDADIFFDDPNWYKLVSDTLDDVDICQPFHTANWLNIENNEIILIRKNSLIGNINVDGHPGFSWAFTRKWFSHIKLPDFCITGGGDTVFNQMIVMNNGKTNDYFKYIVNDMNSYINSIKSLPLFGYVNVNIYHLFHGSRKQRQYLERQYRIINTLNQLGTNDLSDVIDYDSNGLRCWKEEYKQPMNELIKKYLCDRNDDGIE